MEIFGLRGPDFLSFFFALGVGLLLVQYFKQRIDEAGFAPRLQFSDPYLIAYLRGGQNETRRLGVISLIDRGLLTVATTASSVLRRAEFTLQMSSPSTPQMVTIPLERALLEKFITPQSPAVIFENGTLETAEATYQNQLERKELLPSPAVYKRRLKLCLTIVAILSGVAVAKIWVAVRAGHTNILFLVLGVVVLCIGAALIFGKRRTSRGDLTVADLRTLFAGLKARAANLRAGKSPDEVALLVAVFGISALPKKQFPHAKKLYPKASSSSYGSSSCGSTCGSSCGGGGCGGGCGGCGG